MKKYWPNELAHIKQSARENKIKLSNHAEQRMNDRGIDQLDIMISLLSGEIAEGFDVGCYPEYRNPDPLRIIIGCSGNKCIAVGLCIKGQANEYLITTVYQPGEYALANRFFLVSGQL